MKISRGHFIVLPESSRRTYPLIKFISRTSVVACYQFPAVTRGARTLQKGHRSLVIDHHFPPPHRNPKNEKRSLPSLKCIQDVRRGITVGLFTFPNEVPRSSGGFREPSKFEMLPDDGNPLSSIIKPGFIKGLH